MQETADCDSASRQRFPSRDRQCATLLHVAEFCDGQREIVQEDGPIRGARFDQFRLGAQTTAGLAKSVSGGNQRVRRLS